MKLSDWAKTQGIAYVTAFRWFHKGIIPGARQLSTGTILVDDHINADRPHKVVVYARVSSATKKDDLQRQLDRCLTYCIAKGYQVTKTYKEIASGMNDNRKLFWDMIASEPTVIVVEHKDRLTRFGFNYIERLLRPVCSIEVINRDAENEQDLMKDLVALVTSFCCRLYGMRRGLNKAKEIKSTLK